MVLNILIVIYIHFQKKIYLFLKKKNIKEITFFAHSLGGIIPIILVKNFVKKKNTN